MLGSKESAEISKYCILQELISEEENKMNKESKYDNNSSDNILLL